LHSVMVATTQYFIFQSAAKIGMQRNPNITGTTQASRVRWGGRWGKGHAGREGVLLRLEGGALGDDGCDRNWFLSRQHAYEYAQVQSIKRPKAKIA
jgi:hypothetical protein